MDVYEFSLINTDWKIDNRYYFYAKDLNHAYQRLSQNYDILNEIFDILKSNNIRVFEDEKDNRYLTIDYGFEFYMDFSLNTLEDELICINRLDGLNALEALKSLEALDKNKYKNTHKEIYASYLTGKEIKTIFEYDKIHKYIIRINVVKLEIN